MKKYFYKKLYENDLNNREINIYHFKGFFLSGDNLFYPNVILQNNLGETIFPINEKVMSLGEYQKKNLIENNNNHVITDRIQNPVFFFIYNMDNYYHFLYDTLPYLISFFELKKTIKNLKLLVNFPNANTKKLYTFNIEFFEILGINTNDLIFAKSNTEYSDMYVSDSYTHGYDSNSPPRSEIYDFFNKIKYNVIDKEYVGPKKIYISRRSWVHNNFENIGTNYTLKRKLENETEFVKRLNKLGFDEIFTENINTTDKINLFFNATEIVAPIGGGLVNCVFSKKETRLHVLVSPHFLEINKRFLFCMNKVNLNLFEKTYHFNEDDFKLYMRVKCGEILGEVIKIQSDKIKIQYSKYFVSGWNSQIKFKTKIFNKCDCKKIDQGLNSPWSFNIDEFLSTY